MCTLVVDVPAVASDGLLLMGIRDEFVDRAWQPPARHWPSRPDLLGGRDLRAGGTWLAVNPAAGSVSCVVNGSGGAAGPRSRGELPLRAAADGGGRLDRFVAPGVLPQYAPFHLMWGTGRGARVASWDGHRLVEHDLPPGLHIIVNAGLDATHPRVSRWRRHLAVTRPHPRRAQPTWAAWQGWVTALTEITPGRPQALLAHRELPDGRRFATTSVSLVALSTRGLRYDFAADPGDPRGWRTVVDTLP